MKSAQHFILFLVAALTFSGCGAALHSGSKFGHGVTANTRIIFPEGYKTSEYEIPSGLYFPVFPNKTTFSINEEGQTLFFMSIKERIFVESFSGMSAKSGGLAINLIKGKPILKYWHNNFGRYSAYELPGDAQYLFTGQNSRGQLIIESTNFSKVNCDKFLRIISLDPSYALLWKATLDNFNVKPLESCVHSNEAPNGNQI